jgi:ABC-type glycerol-3-phosphate transport system substrate-binding protein
MNRNFKFITATVALTAMTVFTLPNSSAAGVITLTVQTDSYIQPAFKIVADEFEKQNPGVKVELQVLDAQTQTTTNLQIMTSDAAPDVASTIEGLIVNQGGAKKALRRRWYTPAAKLKPFPIEPFAPVARPPSMASSRP